MKATKQQTGPRTKTCCYCGGAILWLATLGGRMIPVDTRPDGTGTIMINQSGKAVALMGDDLDSVRDVEPLYAAHAGPRCHRMKARYRR